MDPPTQLNNPSMELNVSKEESSNSSNATGLGAPLLLHGEAAAALIMLVVAAVIISLTIVGNVLVIVAVLTSRALRAPQNLFLVSLASADILVAALVSPFSLANEVMGYWYLGSTWCACYLALDASSIVHLCAISLDRYWSVTKAVSYNLKSMIGVVWLISAVISFPPLLMTKHGERECLLNDETWYILTSSLFSFFAPALIMILAYCKIYKLGGLERQPSQSETCFMRVEVEEESPCSSQSSGSNTANQQRHRDEEELDDIDLDESCCPPDSKKLGSPCFGTKRRKVAEGLYLVSPCCPSGWPPGPAAARLHLQMAAANKSKVAQMREKHFTFMLVVAMGVFVVCWFPFFFTCSLHAVCRESRYIPRALFNVFFWIGYCLLLDRIL